MASGEAPPAILLMGPTASGKTELAIRLREALDGELISVDSALVYRGMDIGTAKPDAEILARAPHRLIDICDPATPYSAADFREDALRAMDEVAAAGRTPKNFSAADVYPNRHFGRDSRCGTEPPGCTGFRYLTTIENARSVVSWRL